MRRGHDIYVVYHFYDQPESRVLGPLDQVGIADSHVEVFLFPYPDPITEGSLDDTDFGGDLSDRPDEITNSTASARNLRRFDMNQVLLTSVSIHHKGANARPFECRTIQLG